MDIQDYQIVGIDTPPSFKNGKVLVYVKGQARLVTCSRSKKWMQQATRQLERQRLEKGHKRAEKAQSKWNPSKSERVGSCGRKWERGAIVRVVVWWNGKGRLADPDGMLATIMDCLVKAGILADDGPRYVNETRIGWLDGVKDSKVMITIDRMSNNDVECK